MRIVLIGMPGSGKSYWAERIADYYGIPFFDLDGRIQEITSMKIHEIFSEYGEKRFREIERDTLDGILNEENKNFVLSTGGGTPIFHDNLSKLNTHTKAVYIEEKIETLKNRISVEENKRPLFDNKDLYTALNELFSKRKKIYQKAQLKITEPRKIEDFINLIKS